MKTLAKTAPLLLAALLVAACHSTKPAVKPPAEAETPVETPRPRLYTVIPFTAEVEGMNVSGQLRMAEDSAMWVTVSKFIEVGRAMATPDSLFLHAPVLGREEALDYGALRRRTGVDITFAQMQQMAIAPDAERRIEALADKLGFDARLHLGSPRHPASLTFPYTKPTNR